MNYSIDFNKTTIQYLKEVSRNADSSINLEVVETSISNNLIDSFKLFIQQIGDRTPLELEFQEWQSNQG
jgi:hypothetical protein